jgi:hypothetical protein
LKSGAAPLTSGRQSGGDPWGREVLDDLEDLGGDDVKSKKSGGAAQSLLDKKKALFGLPSSATPEID